MMNIALTDDLQRLLRKRVENGQFPNEEAVVEQALRLFLIEEPDQGQAPMSSATEPERESDDDARPWRGVYALEFPEETLFTKSNRHPSRATRRVAAPRSHEREAGPRRR